MLVINEMLLIMISYKAFKNYHLKNSLYIRRLEQFIQENPKQARCEGLEFYLEKAKLTEEKIVQDNPNYA